MKNPTHYCLFLFTNIPVKTTSLKTQLSMISADIAAREFGMISAKFKIRGNSVIQLQTQMLDVLPQRTQRAQRMKL